MKFAIYGSRHQEDYVDAIAAWLKQLSDEGHEAVMHTKLYQYLLHSVPAALACVRRVTYSTDFEADFAVSLGGDGTFLRTAAWVSEKEIPIIGINTGHLGFLAALSVGDLPTLTARLGKPYMIERRSLVAVEAEGVTGWPYALNEVAITKCENASMIQVNTHIDGVMLADYRADGLIVSTPTGSTAYNLSVGGPIVQPGAPVLVLSPIAAHSLSMRPLVINEDSMLEMECEGRAETFRLSIDGRTSKLPMGARVKLHKARFCVCAVQFNGHNFADTLRNKLQWG